MQRAEADDSPSLEVQVEKPVDTQLERLDTLDTIEGTVDIDPVTENRLIQVFDRRVVPWLFILWLLAFIDRSNIGLARIDGLATDLKLGTGDKFNISLTVFYIPYILVDVPSNWLVKRIGAGIYLPALVAGWGVVCLCTGFVKTYQGLLVVRFFLGLMEGGLLGGMILYLSMFYRRTQLMRRIGMFYCAAPLSGAVGGLLATGLSQIRTPGYNGWPFIFFVEGAVTIVVGLVAMVFLPHTPAHAKFLNEDERILAAHRLKIDGEGSVTTSDVGHEKFSLHWVKVAILNWNTILDSINFFAVITPLYSFSLFLPTIISGMGYTKVHANLLTVPPNIVGVITVLLATYYSDRLKRRGIFMIAGSTIALVGYIMLIASGRALTQYGGTFLVAAGVYPCPPIVMGWLANNTAPHYVRATATGFQVGIANCAAFIATFTYITKDSPRFYAGHAINIGMLLLCLVLTTATMAYCKWENGKRERGERDDRLIGNIALLGHRHPNFRYTI